MESPEYCLGFCVREHLPPFGEYAFDNQARALELRGWVSNRPDGSVEVLVEGAAPRIESYLGLLREGPRTGRVEAVEEIAADSREGLQEFEIRYG